MPVMDARFVQQYDNYPNGLRDKPGRPKSTVFVVSCACGCSFAVTVAYEEQEFAFASPAFKRRRT
jgi:hypothetical protein